MNGPFDYPGMGHNHLITMIMIEPINTNVAMIAKIAKHPSCGSLF